MGGGEEGKKERGKNMGDGEKKGGNKSSSLFLSDSLPKPLSFCVFTHSPTPSLPLGSNVPKFVNLAHESCGRSDKASLHGR